MTFPPTCVLLVGGLGTRLRSVVKDVPKPMAPVNGRPFLEHLICHYRDSAIRHFVLCVAYKAEHIERHFGNGDGLGVEIEYSREEELLGTGGALALAARFVRTDPFLAANGDSYSGFDLRGMVKAHEEKRACATLLTAEVPDTSRYGLIQHDTEGRITGALEKKSPGGPGEINSGVYLLGSEVIRMVRRDRVCSLERDVFPLLIGRAFYCFRGSGVFLDIGVPSDLARAGSLFDGSGIRPCGKV